MGDVPGCDVAVCASALAASRSGSLPAVDIVIVHSSDSNLDFLLATLVSVRSLTKWTSRLWVVSPNENVQAVAQLLNMRALQTSPLFAVRLPFFTCACTPWVW